MADGFLRGTEGDTPPLPERAREVLKEWPCWLLLAGIWGYSLWAIGKLPARVPIHWDLHGNVNGWGTPLMASLLLPAIATALILPLILIPSLGAIIYAYWIRHRMEHSGTPTSELP